MQAGTLHERDPDHAALREQVWTRVQLARNVRRPHALELMRHMAAEIVELHGDRLFRDDPAIVGGLARLDRHRIVFVGHQKGAETDENIRRNFGMPHPEGYRKGIRLFQLAERLKLPVVTIVDTPGAFPGQASEERGVAEAIARSIQVLSGLRTPVVVVITGEGGSGGAVALGVGDVVLALENAIYSVISPEGCASILWRSPEAAQDAAVAMRLTAADQAELGVIDQVVAEPGQGAHTDHADTAKRLKAAIVARLDELADQPVDALVQARYGRFRDMGAWTTVEPVVPRSERIGGLAERWGLTDRLRGLLESGRATLTGSVEQPLRPQAGDLADEPPLREEV
ncbi:MAG: acetyl-CoA carboxylase carboxyltransferase subunit alpha [Chloroflexi bacterium]|nr:acetyl-CoA carboxylase carboxyltransferase subunit alpha [Chloroflexota bacterium]